MSLKTRLVRYERGGTIRLSGEVQTIAYYPEYKDQIDRILRDGRGSPKSNWMPQGDWNWQQMKNAIIDGKKILAAMLAYENTDGPDLTDDSRSYNETDPNKYHNRPCGMRVDDTTTGGGPYYYTRWVRGNNARTGSICNEGDDYARYIVQIPTIDTDSSVNPLFDAGTMVIDNIHLIGARRTLAWSANNLLNAGGSAFQTPLTTTFIAYPISLVAKNNGNTKYQHFGWPDDYTMNEDRQDITIPAGKTSASQDAVFTYMELNDPLTTTAAHGNIFSSVVLTDTIAKTSAFALALIWKILLS